MGAVYSKLSIEERRRTERWRHAKVPVREMARVPRKRNLAAVSDHELKMLCDRLNNTLRKCLGWKRWVAPLLSTAIEAAVQVSLTPDPVRP